MQFQGGVFMMLRMRNRLNLMVFFLLFSSLLSACQIGPTNSMDQAQVCHQPSFPIVKTLEPVRPSSKLVYATNGYNLYAFDSGNGVLHWCNTLSVGNGRGTFRSLTYSRGSVYAYTDAGNLTRLDAGSGALVWSTYIEHFAGFFTPPSLIDSTVFGGTKNIYALNTQDGSVRWRYSLPDNTSTSLHFAPVANDGGVYFSLYSTQNVNWRGVYALDAVTGKKRWIFSLPVDEIVWNPLLAGEGAVVVCYQNHQGEIQSGLEILNAQNGTLLWQKAVDCSAGEANENLIIANGLLYVAGTVPPNSTNAVTSLYALDLHTGAIRWSVGTGEDALHDSLLVVNNVLYQVNEHGGINAFNAQTGQVLWHAQFPSVQVVELLSQLVVINDHLFIGTENINDPRHPVYLLHAFNLITHQEDWYADVSRDAAGTGPLIVTG